MNIYVSPKRITCKNAEEALTTAENICIIYPWKSTQKKYFSNWEYIEIIDLITKTIDAELYWREEK